MSNPLLSTAVSFVTLFTGNMSCCGHVTLTGRGAYRPYLESLLNTKQGFWPSLVLPLQDGSCCHSVFAASLIAHFASKYLRAHIFTVHRHFPFKRQIFKTTHGPKEQLSEFPPFLRGVRGSHTVVCVFVFPGPNRFFAHRFNVDGEPIILNL